MTKFKQKLFTDFEQVIKVLNKSYKLNTTIMPSKQKTVTQVLVMKNLTKNFKTVPYPGT